MIVFYIDPKWKREYAHIPLLYPFWGNPSATRTPFNRVLFERHSFDTRAYRLTSNPREAQFLMIPYRYNVLFEKDRALLRRCLDASCQLGLPVFIDGTGDVERPITIKRSVVLRIGGYRSKRAPNDLIIPPYADDLLEGYRDGKFSLRPWTDIPTVGFAGWGLLSGTQRARALARDLPLRMLSLVSPHFGVRQKGVFVRECALKTFASQEVVPTNFLVRRSYSAHVETAERPMGELREEFVENVCASDYALDIRGDANASTRLFEILSLGRIPLIIDTDRNFPFEDEVDYTSFGFRIDFRDIEKAPTLLMEFHRGLDKSVWYAMQKRARDTFVSHFRVDALARQIMKRVEQFARRAA